MDGEYGEVTKKRKISTSTSPSLRESMAQAAAHIQSIQDLLLSIQHDGGDEMEFTQEAAQVNKMLMDFISKVSAKIKRQPIKTSQVSRVNCNYFDM